MGDFGNRPFVASDPAGPTAVQNFTMLWHVLEDDIFEQRDLKQLQSLHPGLESLEAWMRRTSYDGAASEIVLKAHADKARN
jgi:hypothetical protein